MKSDGLNSMETDAMETRDALNNGDPMISVKEATQVLKNDKGRVVSTMALSVAKDTYLSYLLLRHLHTRDNRTTVRTHTIRTPLTLSGHLTLYQDTFLFHAVS